MRVADDERHRHRLAERPAEAEHYSADDADAGIGQDDLPDDLAARGAETVSALLEDRRHGLEDVAHDRRNERQNHDRQYETGGQHADAERRPGEQRAKPWNLAERIDQVGLDILLDERGEYEEPPDAIDDARDGGQQLDHRREWPFQPDRADFGDEHRYPESDRNAHEHSNGGSDEGPVDRCQCPELL